MKESREESLFLDTSLCQFAPQKVCNQVFGFERTGPRTYGMEYERRSTS